MLQKGSLVVKKSNIEITKDFPLVDDDGRYRELELRNTHREFGKHNRKNLYYPFYFKKKNNILSLEDNGGLKIEPNWDDGYEGCWTWGRNLAIDNLDLLVCKQVKGNYKVYRKAYSGQATKKFKTLWIDKKYHTEKGQASFNELFDEGKDLFNAPKSVDLIKDLINVSTEENDIILDSFAGSGTTLHAILDLNNEFGSNRQCIMVQMKEDSKDEPNKNICKNLTRERVKRAIEKYGYDSGFKYLKVGIPIDPEYMLDGILPNYVQFAQYVYYLCFGENLEEADKINQVKHYVGKKGNQAVYLIYDNDFEKLTRQALNLSIAEQIVYHRPNTRRIVYAPACFLDDEYMEAKQIEFVSIPYNLFQRKDS